MFIVVLISLIWEVTLALPYGWWGFQQQAVVGIPIRAWFGLPIEELIVWVAVTYATAIVYEVVEAWLWACRHALALNPASSAGRAPAVR